jgi:hypothetical protein
MDPGGPLPAAEGRRLGRLPGVTVPSRESFRSETIPPGSIGGVSTMQG